MFHFRWFQIHFAFLCDFFALIWSWILLRDALQAESCRQWHRELNQLPFAQVAEAGVGLSTSVHRSKWDLTSNKWSELIQPHCNGDHCIWSLNSWVKLSLKQGVAVQMLADLLAERAVLPLLYSAFAIFTEGFFLFLISLIFVVQRIKISFSGEVNLPELNSSFWSNTKLKFVFAGAAY